MSRFLFLSGLLAALTLGSAARAGTALAASSPFAPPDGAAAVAGENQPLELRGILMDGGSYRFSVYDPAKKSGQWARLNEAGHDFTIRTHDAAKDTITLDYQGRTLTLTLHNSKVVGMAVVPEAPTAPSPGPGSGPQVTMRGSAMGPPPKPPTPEDTARFNRAVEEINRRRALREKGTGSMPMPSPGTSLSTPTPQPRPPQ